MSAFTSGFNDMNFFLYLHHFLIVVNCFMKLRRTEFIGKIRNLIDTHTTHKLVHAFITSRLDYNLL